jgi:hypothetical protein
LSLTCIRAHGRLWEERGAMSKSMGNPWASLFAALLEGGAEEAAAARVKACDDAREEKERRLSKAELDRRIKEIEKKMLGGGCRYQLRLLYPKKKLQDTLLRHLALAADGVDGLGLLESMRGKAAALRSLAGQLETLERHVRRIAEDPFSYVRMWAYVLSRFRGKPPELHPKAPIFLLARMSGYAEALRGEARLIGLYLKQNTPVEKRVGVMVPLRFLWLTRAARRDPRKMNYNALAHLFNYAWEAADRPETFTAAQIQKMAERHLLKKDKEDKATP